jgi:hypothetical protein
MHILALLDLEDIIAAIALVVFSVCVVLISVGLS